MNVQIGRSGVMMWGEKRRVKEDGGWKKWVIKVMGLKKTYLHGCLDKKEEESDDGWRDGMGLEKMEDGRNGSEGKCTSRRLKVTRMKQKGNPKSTSVKTIRPAFLTCANPRATRAQTEPNATENQQLPPASPCGPHRRPPWRRPAHPLLARVR